MKDEDDNSLEAARAVVGIYVLELPGVCLGLGVYLCQEASCQESHALASSKMLCSTRGGTHVAWPIGVVS